MQGSMLYLTEEDSRKLIGGDPRQNGGVVWSGPPEYETQTPMYGQPMSYSPVVSQPQPQPQRGYYHNYMRTQPDYIYQAPPPPPPPQSQYQHQQQQQTRAPREARNPRRSPKRGQDESYLLSPLHADIDRYNSATNGTSIRQAGSSLSPSYGAISATRKTPDNTSTRSLKTHSRSRSESPFDASPAPPTHRRNNSASDSRPPRSKSMLEKVAPINRERINSYGNGAMIPKPKHRRGDSASSIASISSQMSILSDKSIVAEIQKSSLYKEVTAAGLVRMHLPIDNVRLVMDDQLETGKLYQKFNTQQDSEAFFEYHLRSEDDGFADDAELPATTYVLAVDSGLYRRVIGEISDAQDMPCGLFFCGHHEDVDKPSIMIAVTIVGAVFGVIVFLTFFDGL